MAKRACANGAVFTSLEMTFVASSSNKATVQNKWSFNNNALPGLASLKSILFKASHCQEIMWFTEWLDQKNSLQKSRPPTASDQDYRLQLYTELFWYSRIKRQLGKRTKTKTSSLPDRVHDLKVISISCVTHTVQPCTFEKCILPHVILQ